MKKIIFFFLFLVTAISSKDKANGQSKETADIAITNVRLIDGTGDAIQNNVIILIKDGRILNIAENSINIDADSIIDGTDKYVIPGLFDNHIHLGYDETKFQRQMDQLIHFGVTSILVPGADNRKLSRYKADVQEKGIQSPNIYYTSLMTTMEGKHPAKTYGDSVYIDGVNINYIKDENSIEPIVNRAVEDNAIALKLMIEDGPAPPLVERIPDKYVALASEKAHEAGLDFFAHVSDMEEVKIAVNNNVDALMHFIGKLDWENDSDIIEKIIDNDISWVSTAMLGKSFFYPINKEWYDNEHFSVYEPDQKRDFMDPDGSKKASSEAILKGITGSDNPTLEMMVIPGIRDLKKLYDRGVNIVLGTDVRGRPYILPGYSVHEEMELFKMGGFETEQIIQCASLNAAKMLKIDKDYGSIEEGKVADMVLLDKNPLKDISNTLSIKIVFKEGEILERITNANTK